MNEPILFDCDPGSDDAIAILEAFAHPESLQVIAMTTVGGNQTLNYVTRNLQHLLWFLHQKTPIAPGQAGPIIKNLQNAAEIHGANGLAGPTFPASADHYPLASQNGVYFLHQQLQARTTPVTIVATGPLTNIALLLKVFPEDQTKIKQVIVMGGSLSQGNVTEVAEFNFYVDPDAAQIVLTSGLNIVLCGLDVTNHTGLTAAEIQQLAHRGPASQLAYQILVPYFAAETGETTAASSIAAIHDLTTISYLLHPEYFHGWQTTLQVDTSWGAQRGQVQSVENSSQPANILVLNQVNRPLVAQLLFDSLAWLDQQLS